MPSCATYKVSCNNVGACGQARRNWRRGHCAMSRPRSPSRARLMAIMAGRSPGARRSLDAAASSMSHASVSQGRRDAIAAYGAEVRAVSEPMTTRSDAPPMTPPTATAGRSYRTPPTKAIRMFRATSCKAMASSWMK